MVHGIDPRKNQDAWGFCSFSCDENFLKVLKIQDELSSIDAVSELIKLSSIVP